ncbi:MAG: NYN domain-containing protein [Pyrinomonadaceae bacterium]
MPYLIDGNNVMGRRAVESTDGDAGRRRLLDELAGFAQAKRVRVMVVFDGAPLPHFADGAGYKGVRVFYGARDSNADERIKQIVESSRERRTLIVATSDRALGEYVRRCGAQVIRAPELRLRMAEAARRDEEKKGSPTTASNEPVTEKNVGAWMRYFGVAPEDDE